MNSCNYSVKAIIQCMRNDYLSRLITARKWVKPRNNIRQLVWSGYSSLIIFIATKLPEKIVNKSRQLKDLREYLNYDHPPTRSEDVLMPEGMELTLLSVYYYELVFVEDFARLREGFLSLNNSSARDMSRSPFVRDEQIMKWFSQCETELSMGAGCRLGSYSLKTAQDNIKFVDVEALRLGHSVILLRYSATPTEKFLDELKELLRRKVSTKPYLLRFGLFSKRGFGVTRTFAPKVRQDEIEDHFLLANRDVVTFLRRYLNVGWHKQGPLPSVEAYSLDKQSYSLIGAGEFWRAMDAYTVPGYQYKAQGISLHRSLSTFQYIGPEPCRLFVQEETFRSGKLGGGAIEKTSAITSVLERSIASALICLLSVNEIDARLSRRLASIRGPIIRSLQHQGALQLTRPFRLHYAVQMMSRLNMLSLEHMRAREEVPDDWLECFEKQLASLTRDSPGEKKEAHLGSDLLAQIRFSQDNSDKQLDVLNSSLKDALANQIQWVAFTLAVIGIILGVLQFLPEDVKMAPYNFCVGVLSRLMECLH